MTGPILQPPTRKSVLRRAVAKLIPGLLMALLLLPLLARGQQSPNFDEVEASATAAREQGDVSRAAELYRQAVELRPNWPDGWWYLGILQYGSNAYAPAADALSHFINLTPNAGPALALRGLCEFEQAQYPQSLQDLQRAIALGAANEPRNAGIIFYHEALLLTRLGRYEEALAQYTTLVKHGSLSDDVYAGIGLAGLRMPLLPKDIDSSQQQMVLKVGQAAASVMNGDLTAGREAFQNLFTLFPATPNIHYLYGYLLFTVDPTEAIAQFRRELNVSPASAVAHSMLAWALGTQGDFTAALPYAKQSVAEDPSLAVTQLVLGKDLVETGDVNAGLPHLEAALKIDPQNLEAHIALAKAYSELGRKDDARRERLLCLTLSGKQAAPDANF